MRATRTGQPPRRARGITLVELVVVLTIVGLLASLGATLVGRLMADRQDSHGRLMLATAADAALARIGDELQRALPNSLRLTSNASGTWIEWVPVRDAGRYRQAADTVAADPGDPLDLEDPADGGFDVIGTPLAALAADAQLVLRNLGTSGADAYEGSNRRAGLVLGAAGAHLAFTPAGALPAGAPNARFFIVAEPVTLACVALPDGRFELRRYGGYGWSTTQPASTADLAAADSALLLGGLRGCSAAYGTALANIGLLNLRLAAGDATSAARMDFLQQLALDNTP